MKTVKLVCMAMMSMAMIMVSCSGEDGEQGIPGEDGTDGINGVDGADGADGADGISCWDLNGNGAGDAEEDVNNDGNFDALDCQGADGVDGNSNVNDYDFLLTEFTGPQFTVNLIEGSAFEGDINNYAFLYYIRDQPGNWISVPAPILDLYYSYVVLSPNADITVRFYNNDDTPWDTPGFFSLFRVVAIEFSTQGNKSAQEGVMSELKAAGVDTSDYNAVAEYFGLE